MFAIFFGIILILFGILSLFFGGMIFEEGDSEGLGIAFVGFILVALGTSICVIEVSELNYKQGQIDALSGDNIQYELKVQSDSSRVWVKKDEN